MSVTFNRNHLLATANRALANHEKAGKDRQKAIEEYKLQHRLRHIRTYTNSQRELRDLLTKGLKSSGPISLADVRRAIGGIELSKLFYTPPRDYDIKNDVKDPEGYLNPAEYTETRALVKVLTAATGDTISANELKLLGLKNLVPIFTAAAQQ